MEDNQTQLKDAETQLDAARVAMDAAIDSIILDYKSRFPNGNFRAMQTYVISAMGEIAECRAFERCQRTRNDLRASNGGK